MLAEIIIIVLIILLVFASTCVTGAVACAATILVTAPCVSALEPALASTPEPAIASTPEPALASTPEPAIASAPEPARGVRFAETISVRSYNPQTHTIIDQFTAPIRKRDGGREVNYFGRGTAR